MASVRCARASEITSQPLQDRVESVAQEGNGTLVTVDGLDKVYPLRGQQSGHAVRANQDLTFEAARGRTLAIVGESGSGKSTFANILMGLTKATDGRLLFEAIDLAQLPVERRPALLLRQFADGVPEP